MISLNLDTGASGDDERVILDGLVVAVEGTTPSYIPVGRVMGRFDTQIAVHNSGAYVFCSDLDGSSSDDDIVLAADATGVIGLIAREGSQLVGAPVGWLTGSVHNAVITDAGFGYTAKGVDGGPPNSEDTMVMVAGSMLVQTGVDTPTGQQAMPVEPWQAFDLNRVFVSADGSNILVQGDLTGSAATDDVIVLNGAVVVQEGFALPGTGIADAVANASATMHNSGTWMSRGTFAGSGDGWAMRNGAIIAQVGSPIFAGAVELFQATNFFVTTCNGVGDYVVGGATDMGVDVLVLNNDRVIAREGDPVDLDGNGLFDDGVFYGSFGFDDSVLTDDGRLFVNGRFMDSGGTNLGDFLVIITIGGGSGAPFCMPADTNSTGMPTLLSGTMTAPGGSGLHLEATQGPSSQFGYFLVATGAMDPGTPVGSGHLCLAGSIGRYNVSGTASNSIGQFDGAGVMQNLVGTSTVGSGFDVPTSVPSIGGSIMAGSTWHFQVWHRDIGTQSNFSNGYTVTF